LSKGNGEFGESRGGLSFFGAHFLHDGGFEFWDALQAPQVTDDAAGKFMFEEGLRREFEEQLAAEGFVGVGFIAGDDIGAGG
jgi:hypothetical protein